MYNFPIVPGDRVLINWPNDLNEDADSVLKQLQLWFPGVDFRVYYGGCDVPEIVMVYRDPATMFGPLVLPQPGEGSSSDGLTD